MSTKTQPSRLTARWKPLKLTLTTWLIGMPSSSLTVRTESRGPPRAYAVLILPVPWPGISTFRSRGIDITAVAFFSGSSRTTIIVSERTGVPFSSPYRRSEPSTRIVCGPPGSTSSSTDLMPGIGVDSFWKTAIVSCTCSRTALATAVALSSITMTAPIRKRFHMSHPRRVMPSPS